MENTLLNYIKDELKIEKKRSLLDSVLGSCKVIANVYSAGRYWFEP